MQITQPRHRVIPFFIQIKQLFYTGILETLKDISKYNTGNLPEQQISHKGQKCFQNYYNDIQTSWYNNMSKEYIVRVNRVKANRYNLAASFAGVNITVSVKYKRDYENEDISHVICQLYDSQRKYLMKQLLKLKLPLPLNIEINCREIKSRCMLLCLLVFFLS